MDNSPVILALVGIVGAVITALFKLLADNTKALNALVDETKTGNVEAKQRNGHLGEQNVQIATLVTHQGTDIAAIRQAIEKSTTVETEIGSDGKKSVTKVSTQVPQ